MKKNLLIFLGAILGNSTWAALTIPEIPPIASTNAEPNILYILDDSGSMGLSYVPDMCEEGKSTRVKSAHYNKLYYNPNVTYSPPVDYDGTSLGNQSFTAAKENGYSTSSSSTTVDLSTDYKPTWAGSSTGCGAGDYAQDPKDSAEPAYYYTFSATNANCDGSATDEDCYTKVVVSATSGPGGTDERTNFANWYAYYRTRLLTAKAGTMRAFANLGNDVRVGYGRINKESSSIDGTSTSTLERGVRTFTGSDRQSFFNWIKARTASEYKPLRRALDDAGRYFQRTDDKGPYDTTPGESGGSNLSCRQNFTVLMTDGYWDSTEDSTKKGNNDGTGGSTITGPNGESYTYSASSPFKDSYSDTLADVAMYYWKNDLTSLTNNVPTSSRDPAFWQHMVTFGLGLGVPTSINPEDAFAAIYTGASIIWPDPVVSYTERTNLPPGRSDDLLHAAVNGHGGFSNAQTPEEFYDSLHGMLQGIVGRKGALSSVITNSTSLSSDTHVFQAVFESARWSGDLLAYPVNSTGVSDTPVWKASENIPDPTGRKIFLTSSDGVAREFLWSSLIAADKTALGSEDVLNYLRGVRSQEQQNGGSLRNRSVDTVLGDIVHSSPFYVKDTNTVYVGANDGMLHAFDASSGKELFTYIPSAVISRLKDLSQPSYTHEYFVDGDIAVSTQAQTSGHNYLVATLGHGGKGLFGLDVVNHTGFGVGDVKWEYFSASDADLGYMLGRPVIAKMNDGSWAVIVGNGYNSSSGKAVLYIFDLATGSVLKKLDTEVAGDNGLAAPGVFDSDDDGDVDYIYAGDLKGNVWKFDVTDSSPTNWKLAFGSVAMPEPLFVAKDPSNNPQPITAQITVAKNDVSGDPNYGKRFIFFGTGSYFRSDDPSDVQVQNWYGLIDDATQITSRSDLKQRTILEEGTVSGNPVRTFSQASSGDMTGKKGWYIDLKKTDGTAQGERIVTTSKVYKLVEPVLIASSIIPVVDPCLPGGTGYINVVNPFTGARPSQGIFDLNGNGTFSDDKLNDSFVGSVDVEIGMPSEPVVVGNRLVVGGSSGQIKDLAINLGVTPNKGRISWREIVTE